jgi:hypothetical protein
MAKTKISEYSATPADNTDINNINIAEGCSPANVNNAIRGLMAQLKDQQDGSSGDPFTVAGTLVSSGTVDITGAFRLDGTAGASGQALVSAGGSNTPTWSTLGTMAAQNSTTVAITGGTITGITDLAVADGGTGASTLSANAVLLGNGTSALQTVAPSTSGNVLTSNGTTWTSAALNFDKSLATSGYQKLPSGLIIQWGKSSFNVGQDATITGTWSITFPTSCLTFHPTGFSDVTSGDARLYGAFQISSASTTGFSVSARNNVNSNGLIGNLNWMAIGY